MPALFTSTSSRPSAESMVASAAATDASSVTSSCTNPCVQRRRGLLAPLDVACADVPGVAQLEKLCGCLETYALVRAGDQCDGHVSPPGVRPQRAVDKP
jgi:hypothetical protein